MSYYVSGFDSNPLYLEITKTKKDEFDDGSTKIDAIVRAITHAHYKIELFSKENSADAQNKIERQKDILHQLGKLLTKVT